MDKQTFDLASTEKVVIYGRDSCPYCVRVKKVFDGKKVTYDYRNTDANPEFEKQRAELETKLNYDTVPMVFIGGKFIGGCSDTQELDQQGKLDPLLA
ncbi:hypothetical protein pb186bvf_018558 [Paramecium bursaria]